MHFKSFIYVNFINAFSFIDNFIFLDLKTLVIFNLKKKSDV